MEGSYLGEVIAITRTTSREASASKKHKKTSVHASICFSETNAQWKISLAVSLQFCF